MTTYHFNNIPNELKALKHWCVWRGDKSPRTPQGGYAKSNDISTWSSYDECLKSVKDNKADGLGFFFSPPYFGVDLDHKEDDLKQIKGGDYNNFTGNIIMTLDSYTEYSRSGNGIHIICKGTIPLGRRRKEGFEVYQEGRFFIMTGNVINNKPVADRTQEIKQIHDKIFEKDKDFNSFSVKTTKNYTLEDFEKGNWQQYGFNSQSEADLAYCNLLFKQYNGDLQKVDEAFRNSGMYRPKWDKLRGDKTYGELTLSLLNDNKGHNNYTWDDVGNAKRFVDSYKDVFKYNLDNKSWQFYNGKYWQGDCDTQATNNYIKMLDNYYNDLKHMDDDLADKYKVFIKQSRANTKINGCLNIAKNFINANNNDFDKNLYQINLQNGIYDLQEKIGIPHASNAMLTHYIDVKASYGEPKLWLKFLNEIFLNDEDLIEYIQALLGYALSGDTSDQAIYILLGSGNNGKSVFIDILTKLFGSYLKTIQADTIGVKSNNSANSDIARLVGARLVICSENNDGLRLNEGLVKQLSGGDRVTARFLYGKEFEFKPIFKLFLNTNHLPIIRGTDEGIWRRIRVIPFDYTIPENKKDFNLINKLEKELPQILRWCIEGFEKFENGRLRQLPTRVQYQNTEYKTNMSPIEGFIENYCKIGDDYSVNATSLYQAYAEYCKTFGEYQLTQTKFGIEIGKKFEKVRLGGYVKYIGLNLKINL